ncbi:MAG: hypothetical protein WAT79_08865 [Saprospiraceae bacterium]
MIYDVLTSFNSGNVKYDKDSTDPSIPIEGLSTFVKNNINIQSTKLGDIEKSFNDYSTMQDDILGIEIHNEDQYNRIKDSRIRMGISDDFFDFSLEDLSNTAKITQAKNKIKRYVDSPELKSILEEQKEAKDYMAKVGKINSMNPGLAILAKKDYIEKYGNRKDRSYSGFDLDINNYLPLDIDEEMSKLAKDIEREYRLERDPNSPTGEGYLFINKVSGVTENGREIFDRKMNMLRQNKRFDNNVNSLIALNSENNDYKDEEAKNLFITTMMEDHLADKVESTEIKKIELPKIDKDGNSTTKNVDGGTEVKTKVDRVKDVMSGRKTEAERYAAELRMIYEEDPAYDSYDFSKFDVDARQVKGVAQDPVVDEKTGDLMITFLDNNQVNATLRVKKIKPGEKRNVLLEKGEESTTISQTPAEVKASQDAISKATQDLKEDVTVNNPGRKKAVDEAGVNKNYSGGMTPDGKWVYKGAGTSGKVVVIDDPVAVKDIGLNTKDTTRNGNGADMHLNKSTAMKAKDFHDTLGLDYQITEAGTDTLDSVFNGHKNKKHYDGTSYDMSLRGDAANDPNAIFKTIVKANEKGLRAQFETNDANLAAKINAKIKGHNIANPKNKIVGSAATGYKITGNHFSIYDDAPVENMIKEGDVAAIDMAGSGNSDYANFVDNKRLKFVSREDVVTENSKYLKDKHKPVFDELSKANSSDTPSFGQIQGIMGLISQSKKLGNYLNQNPKDAINLYKFVRSPEVQEMYMDSLMDSYSKKISTLPDESKFSDIEKYVIMHTSGEGGGYDKIKGSKIMNGPELLKKHGFLVDDEYVYSKSKYEKAISSISDETQKSLFKMAIMDAEGELDQFNGDTKEILGYIETNPKQFGNKRYMIVNPGSTSVGKYQIMWSKHSDKLNNILGVVDSSYVDDVEESQSVVSDSLSRREKYNIR